MSKILNIVWDLSLNCGFLNIANSVSSDNDYLYVLGNGKMLISEWNNILIKVDNNGKILWTRLWKIDKPSYGLNVNVQNNVYIVVDGINISYLIKYNKEGRIIWKKEISKPIYTLHVVNDQVYAAGRNIVCKLKDHG